MGLTDWISGKYVLSLTLTEGIKNIFIKTMTMTTFRFREFGGISWDKDAEREGVIVRG
jgi:hypothetical protein